MASYDDTRPTPAGGAAVTAASAPYPVQIRATREETASRWLWLVKWLLLIPHYLVLAVLGSAAAVLTVVAYVAIMVTGRYPAGIFEFNVGVLRWAWRVAYYGYGVLGTDRYPPFTLSEVPAYPAGMTVREPSALPRWLPLVAWALALPHAMIVGALQGGIGWRVDTQDGTTSTSVSVVGAVVLVTAMATLFTGRRPDGLTALLSGIARWTVRTIAYVALLTDRYPPFRLDQEQSWPADPSTAVGSVPAAGAPDPWRQS